MANNPIIGPGIFPEFMYLKLAPIIDVGKFDPKRFWYINICFNNNLIVIKSIVIKSIEDDEIVFSSNKEDGYGYKFRNELVANNIKEILSKELISRGIMAGVSVESIAKFPILKIGESIDSDKVCEIFKCDGEGRMRISGITMSIVVISKADIYGKEMSFASRDWSKLTLICFYLTQMVLKFMCLNKKKIIMNIAVRGNLRELIT